MARDMLIQVRAGTAAEWAAANPVLGENEPGYVTDTHSLRFGDGTTQFSALQSMSGGISVSEAITTRQVPYVPAIPDIIDPGFEESTLTGWTAFERGQFSNGVLTLSSAQFHGGAQSLKIDMTGSSNVYGVYQNLDLRDTSHITFWVYSSSNCNLMMTADPAPVDFTDFTNVGTPPNMEWTQYSYEIPEEFRVKDGVIMIGILANVGGTVTAYLDDVSYILDGASDECNFIADIDQYIEDEVDIRLGLPAKTTAKQIVFRPVTGEDGDYDWIPDLDAYIDDEIDTHLNLPDKTETKQVPYRSILRNVLEKGDMDDGPLVSSEHVFTTEDVDALINENHVFVDDTTRNSYFSSHPEELEEGLLIYSWYRYQKYISSTWTDQDEDEMVAEVMEDYFTAHPEDLVEGATRSYTASYTTVYERYVDSTWTELEEDDFIGEWVPGEQGSVHNYNLSAETTEKHGGTGSLKTTYTLENWSDFFGAGIKICHVDLTYATHVSIWVKGAGDAVGKLVTETDSTESSEQEISDEWAQYTFEISSGCRGPDQTLCFIVGETYADSEDEYEVYWDDCTLVGGIEDELEWIDDIDTYIDDRIEDAIDTDSSGGIENAIETHLNIPNKTTTKQMPYRPIMAYVVPDPSMDGITPFPNQHIFTLGDVETTINENHFFATTGARDSYFSSHPEELVDQMLIVGYKDSGANVYQRYNSGTSSWGTVSNQGILISDYMDDYFSSNPEELVEGAVRYYVRFNYPAKFEKYTGSAWVTFDSSDYEGTWLPAIAGTEIHVKDYDYTLDASEKHSGTHSIKTVYSPTGASSPYCGIQRVGVDTTHATHAKIWAKGAGDVIGRPIRIFLDGTLIGSQTLTDSWVEYTISIPENQRGPGTTLMFVAQAYYTSGENTVYWDDCSLVGDIEISENEIDWIEDLDDYIDDRAEDTVDSYLAAPAKTATKQVLCRPARINIVPHGNMETLLVAEEHLFTLDDIDESISESHFFADTSARDTYFTSNPGELTEGVLVAIIGSPMHTYYRYESSAWVEYSGYDAYGLAQAIMEDYYTDHPEEEYEGATRAFDWGSYIEIDVYTEGAWDYIEDHSGGWFTEGGYQYYYDHSIDTENQHSGTGCIKTTFTLSNDYPDYFAGEGIWHDGVDLTYAAQVKIWVKAADDAIGKQLMLTIGTYELDSQTITDEWAEYSFDVPEGYRSADQSLMFLVGEINPDPSDQYTVYWDDCTLDGGDIEPQFEWIPDIDTYFDDKYVGAPLNPESHDGVIPIHYPGLTLINDPLFEGSWSTCSYEEAGVTPNISPNTNTQPAGDPPYRQIYFTLSSDGSSAPAVVSHRFAFDAPVDGNLTGTVSIYFFGTSDYTGLSLWIEKLASDGSTVLGTIPIDSAVMSAGTFVEVTFDGINEIEGVCGGIGIRLEIESTASMSGMRYLQIAAPLCDVETETQFVAEETMSRWRGTAASDPSDSRGGDMYYNTGDSKVYIHNGTSFIALT